MSRKRYLATPYTCVGVQRWYNRCIERFIAIVQARVECQTRRQRRKTSPTGSGRMRRCKEMYNNTSSCLSQNNVLCMMAHSSALAEIACRPTFGRSSAIETVTYINSGHSVLSVSIFRVCRDHLPPALPIFGGLPNLFG